MGALLVSIQTQAMVQLHPMILDASGVQGDKKNFKLKLLHMPDSTTLLDFKNRCKKHKLTDKDCEERLKKFKESNKITGQLRFMAVKIDYDKQNLNIKAMKDKPEQNPLSKALRSIEGSVELTPYEPKWATVQADLTGLEPGIHMASYWFEEDKKNQVEKEKGKKGVNFIIKHTLYGVAFFTVDGKEKKAEVDLVPIVNKEVLKNKKVKFDIAFENKGNAYVQNPKVSIKLIKDNELYDNLNLTKIGKTERILPGFKVNFKGISNRELDKGDYKYFIQVLDYRGNNGSFIKNFMYDFKVE